MAVYARERYFLMTVDPVHIGTGGYRLGGVDLSIVREPGTKVPKIPGTSLSGATRTYAASQYGSLRCAGQGQPKENREGHCGRPECPICYTFGSLKEIEEKGEKKIIAHSGVVNLFDARLVLFPVHSMIGPVWVSTAQRLKDADFKLPDSLPSVPMEAGLYTWDRPDPLNLGWLMLDAGPRIGIEAPTEWTGEERWHAVRDHIVLVQEALFGQVVNSNLEVRTSVSIDPERGAAEEGALFTYEAIPRAAFLASDVVLDDYRDGEKKRRFPVEKTYDGRPLPNGPWKTPLDVVRAGFRLMAWLGVGGMGTRGFGRVALVGKPKEDRT